MAKLSLVGAGPGDPDLISVKGVKALRNADVVLYDALTHPDLLDYAEKDIPKIFVGKRAGKHSFRQDEINQLIIDCAHEYGHVVRLKGGDPFIFGRGHEEMEYARLCGLEVACIPGISSATSLAGLQHVPLTRRFMSESMWVVTATTREGTLSKDIHLAAQSSASIVILMGMRKLAQIVEVFKGLNNEHTPAMIIQNGSLENEKVVVGPLEKLPELAIEKGIGTPAIIVIGEVVSLHKQFPRHLISKSWIHQ